MNDFSRQRKHHYQFLSKHYIQISRSIRVYKEIKSDLNDDVNNKVNTRPNHQIFQRIKDNTDILYCFCYLALIQLRSNNKDKVGSKIITKHKIER